MFLRTSWSKAQLYLFFAILLLALPHLTTLYAGQVLVAVNPDKERSPPKAVVFVLHHDLGGAQGLILNKKLSDGAFPSLSEKLHAAHDRLYFGGPQGFPETVSVMTQRAGEVEIQPLEDALKTNPGLLENTAAKFYVGYTGWKPLELEREILKHGVWEPVPPDKELIAAATQPETLWDKAYNKTMRAFAGPAGGV